MSLVNAVRERRAVLAARRVREHRAELLGPRSLEAALRERSRLETSRGVTQGLRRARQALAEELQHTDATLRALDMSQQQLKDARDEYVGQAPLLRRAGLLLKQINWQANLVRHVICWMRLCKCTDMHYFRKLRLCLWWTAYVARLLLG